MPATSTDERPVRQQVEPEFFLKRYRDIADAKRDTEEAKQLWKAELHAASGSGINVKALKLCDKIRKMAPVEGQAYIRETILYLHWLGYNVLEQEVLFADQATAGLTDDVVSTHRAWEAGRAGYEAGRAGTPLDANPFKPGSEEYARWSTEWRDGSDDRPNTRDIFPRTHEDGNPEDPEGDPL